MKIFFFLIPALFASILLPAQNKYFTKGKIVTNTGDTISGFIERLRDNALSDGIIFKKDINSKEQQLLTPYSISGFSFPGENRVYESISFSDTTTAHITHEKKFANLLLKGYCSLYILYLKPEDVHIINETGNDHIFLAKKPGSVTVLAEYESITNSIYYLDKQYVDILLRLFSDCSSIDSSDIAQTGFYSKSMIHLFTKYNLYRYPGVALTTFKTKEKLKFTSTIYGGSNIFVHKDVKSVWGTDFGIFFSIIHPRVNERLALSFGFNYRNFKYSVYDDIDGMRENYTDNLIGLPINITFYFSNNKIAPFFDMGVEPALVKENYFDKNGLESNKDFLIFSSFGPGVNILNVYLSAVVEISGIVMVKTGSFFRFRIGYRF